MSSLTEFVRCGFEFLYPPACAICQTSVSGIAAGKSDDGLVCADCRSNLTDNITNVCRGCGSPLGPYLTADIDCAHCRGRKFVFEQVIRLGLYDGQLRKSCIRAKSSRQEVVAAALAERLWHANQNRFESAQFDVVVPVPQYWLHRLWKPHNPPMTLGTVLARKLQVNFDAHILAKIRNTPDQSSLSSQQRRANLRDAFRVRKKGALAGQHVLLVDDILTTGTTANEASKALRKAGAQQITVAVIAVVPLGLVSTSK